MSYEVWWWRTCLHIALKHRQSHNICEESRCSAGSGVGTHSRMLTNSPTDIPLCNSLWYTWRVTVSDTSCFMEKSAILSQWRCNENLKLMRLMGKDVTNVPADRSTHAHWGAALVWGWTYVLFASADTHFVRGDKVVTPRSQSVEPNILRPSIGYLFCNHLVSWLAWCCHHRENGWNIEKP